MEAPAALGGDRGLPLVLDAGTESVAGALRVVAPPRVIKISETVAADIVRDVVARGLRVGDHLPSEAVMLQQYAIGRESLREALRLLEAQGMITIKRGPGGGPVVAGVDPRYLARTSALFFHLSGATYDEVIEAWQVLEPAVAAQVARLPDRALVRRVLAPFADPLAHHDSDDVHDFGIGFHTSLAQLSGSRVLVLLLRALSHIVIDQVTAALDHEEDGHVLGVDDHAEIAQAICDGRAVKAQRLMRDHIGSLRASCQRRNPEKLVELVDWR